MKIGELVDKKKSDNKITIKAAKPRDPNWELMQAKRSSGAMGKHSQPIDRKPKHKLRAFDESKEEDGND